MVGLSHGQELGCHPSPLFSSPNHSIDYHGFNRAKPKPKLNTLARWQGVLVFDKSTCMADIAHASPFRTIDVDGQLGLETREYSTFGTCRAMQCSLLENRIPLSTE